MNSSYSHAASLRQLVMNPSIKHWSTPDGLAIHCRIWDLPGASREIWLVHGMGDHGGRNQELAERLHQQGFRVVLADQRGCGLSEGKRGHAPRFETLVDDLHQTVMQTQTEAAAKFLLGQSMGGLVVARYLAMYRSEIRRAALLSPLFRTTNPPPPWLKLLARTLNRVYPSLTFQAALKVSDLTSDVSKQQQYLADPLKHQLISAALADSVLRAGETALAEADRMNVPLLIMHGDEDQITCPAASQAFADKSPRAEFRLWRGKRHDLQHETDNEPIIATLIAWLDELTAAETPLEVSSEPS